MIAMHERTGLGGQAPDFGGTPQATPAETRRPGVLVAAADPRARSELASFLAREGFDVWAAGDGVEAITTYLDHPGSVDVLLLDADLPDLPGPAFLRRFKTHFPGVPCVFRAGGSSAVAAQLRAAGATVVPASLPPAALAGHLWELLAFEYLIEA